MKSYSISPENGQATIKIPNYFEDLKNAEPTQTHKKVRYKHKGMSSIRIVPSDIPPLNTIINYEDLPTYNPTSAGLSALTHEKLPESWDWRHVHHDDSKEMRHKKTMIEKPQNQALCGSCWAVSVSGVVSDNFVAMGLTKYAPFISATYALTCYPQLQCNGGNPAKLLNDIAKHGIGDMRCIDYSWCLKNPKCNGNAVKHFSGKDLNALIPTCGCYNPNKTHYKYFVKNVERISITSDDKQTSQALKVKNHIYHNGPVLGSYLVYNNFKGGDFTRTGGVYLENANYSKSGKITFVKKGSVSGAYMGSHAVAIIGWGISKNVVVDNEGTKKDVPYWYVRNSWKDTWGADNGYFKMAMFPFNKLSQFDKTVVIDSKNKKFQGGGIVMFTATDKKNNENQKKSGYTGDLLHDKNYYDELPKDKKISDSYKAGGKEGNGGTSKTVKNIGKIIGIIIGIALLLVGIYFLVKYFKSKHKKSSILTRRSSKRKYSEKAIDDKYDSLLSI